VLAGGDHPGGREPAKGIPDATVARLPVYLRTLNRLAEIGLHTVSSGDLAEAAGVNSAQLRKDLSYLGSYGTRGVGYDVSFLLDQIGREVGSTQDWPVIIVGMGNLGTAIANYSGLRSRGFRVVALVDPNLELVGRRLDGVTITDLADLEQTIPTTGARIGVLATPAAAAQTVCDRLGVTSILNFAAAVLTVPVGVNVRKVDLGQELQILAYHEQRKQDPYAEPPDLDAADLDAADLDAADLDAADLDAADLDAADLDAADLDDAGLTGRNLGAGTLDHALRSSRSGGTR